MSFPPPPPGQQPSQSPFPPQPQQPGQPFPQQGYAPPPKKSSNMMVILIVLGVLLCGGVGILGILAAIAVPNFLEAQVRSKVSRARSDMRSMATAIEAYFVDCNSYPAYTTYAAESIDSSLASQYPNDDWQGPFFRAKHSTNLMTLTTPIAYMTSMFPDPFANTPGRTFNYYSPGQGWIIWSAGPDQDYDLDPRVYDPRDRDPFSKLAPYTYDPTNGTVSTGDVIRIKQ